MIGLLGCMEFFPVCEAAKAVTKSYFCVLHVGDHIARKKLEKDNNLHGGEINFGATSVLRMQLCIQTMMGHQAGIIHIFQCLIHPGSFCISSSMYFALQLQWPQLEHVSLFSYIEILVVCR